MSGTARTKAPPAPAEGLAPLNAWIESLRDDAHWRRDPAAFHYMLALSRRMAGQSEPARKILHDKLRAAVADHVQRMHEGVQPQESPAAGATRETPASRLAALNAYAQARRPKADERTDALGEIQADELRSASRFRRMWAIIRTQDQVAQAASQKPANAGPLNSHVLVLQSLQMMQSLSPHYLRRFLVHVEALQWLAQAGEAAADPPPRNERGTARPKSRSRPRK